MNKEKQTKQTKEEKKFSIIPVKALPPSTRKVSGIYNDILDQIMADKTHDIFDVSVKGKNWKSIYSLLDIKIRSRRLPLKLFVRVKEGKLYLKKYGSYEEVEKLRKEYHKKPKQ